MELKDLVKEVLGEIQATEQENKNPEDELQKVKEIQEIFNEQDNDDLEEKQSDVEPEESIEQPSEVKNQETLLSDESEFLNSLRERLLVLFEGFNSPNNTNVEAKLDLTVNFLELVLAKVEDRLDTINEPTKKD
ncbi:MAG: hypothetical protein OIF32_09395 [Campylobacterales bacterium]|nr:hypothetical protein [Campylobacterales bacterium]